MTMLEAALAYAARGFHVFPIRPREKKPPLCKHGFQDATTDEKQICQWLTATRDANLGLACAASGMVVIDVDHHGDIDGEKTLDALKAELGPLPETVEALTGGGGRHLVFAAVPGAEFRGNLGPGVDIKHDGYIVVWPSIHPSGNLYRWLRSLLDEMPVPLPNAWIAAMVKPATPKVTMTTARATTTTARTTTTGGIAYGRSAVEAEIATVRTAPPGTQNNTLNTSALKLGSLFAGGEIDDCREDLVQAAMAVGQPEGQSRKTVESGWAAGRKNPRTAPPREGKPAAKAVTNSQQPKPSVVLRLASAMVPELFGRPLPPALPTGFPQLDAHLGGGWRGLNVLAAPTGVGKTGFALGQARVTARTRPVLYVSTELDERQAIARVTAQELGRPWRPLYESSDAATQSLIASVMAGMRLYVLAIGGTDQLLDALNALGQREAGPALVVLDYLQGLARSVEDRRQAVGAVSEMLMAWPRTTGGVVLAVSSISRAQYHGADEKSATEHVGAAKESGDIEYDASAVLRLDVPPPPLGGTSVGRLHIAKARFGGPGTIGLFFDGPTGTFQADPAGGLTKDQRAVLDAITGGARSGNAIAKDAGIQRAKVNACLRALHARNLIDAYNNLLVTAPQRSRQNGQNVAPLPGNTCEVFPGAEMQGESPSEKVFPSSGKQAVSSRTVSAPIGAERETPELRPVRKSTPPT